MKTLVYKVNGSIADPSAPEFGLLVIKAKKNSPSATHFGIRFESYFDDVEIEYDDTIRVSEGGAWNENPATNYERGTDYASGKYTVPKANAGTITRYSTTGGLVWFPWNSSTEVQIKVHHAYHLGGIQNLDYSYPTPAYGAAIISLNLLDCMGLSKLSTALNFNLYMEDLTFDFRNFIHFPNLVAINGAFNNPGPLWLSQKPDLTYDVDYLNLTNPIPVDNDTFSRKFNDLLLDNATLRGSLTSLYGFKVKTLRSYVNSVADKFTSLLLDVEEPFFASCDIKLNVSEAITTDMKHNLYVKVQAVGGHIYFEYDPSLNPNPWIEYTE